jgi:hypothetical protein
MLGSTGEPVEVWLTDGRPGRFYWRGRIYTVMLVLEYEPDTGAGANRECWQVEATPQRVVPPTTYELCHDIAADRWSLLRG